MKHKFIEKQNSNGWKTELVYIPEGKWFFLCCQEDLQISIGEEVPRDLVAGYFDTKLEAKIEIIKEWFRSYKYIGVRNVVKNIIKTIIK